MDAGLIEQPRSLHWASRVKRSLATGAVALLALGAVCALVPGSPLQGFALAPIQARLASRGASAVPASVGPAPAAAASTFLASTPAEAPADPSRAVGQLRSLIGAARTVTAAELNEMDEKLFAMARSGDLDAGFGLTLVRNIQHAQRTGDAGFEQLCAHLLARLEEAAERVAETPEQKLLATLARAPADAAAQLRLHFAAGDVRPAALADALRTAQENLESFGAGLGQVGLSLDSKTARRTLAALRSVASDARAVLAELYGPAAQQAFTEALVPGARARAPAPVMQLFGPKKTPEEILEEKGYWPGEWVCADCGYIYEPGTMPPFEELRKKWKCPQCAGPRRRFVKKAGGMVAQIDDSPLLIGTAAFAVATVVLVYLGLTI